MESIGDILKNYTPQPYKPRTRFQLLNYFSDKLKSSGQDIPWVALAKYFTGVSNKRLEKLKAECDSEAIKWGALFWDSAKKLRDSVPHPKQEKLF